MKTKSEKGNTTTNFYKEMHIPGYTNTELENCEESEATLKIISKPNPAGGVNRSTYKRTSPSQWTHTGTRHDPI